MVPGSSWESRSGTLGGAELGLIIKLKRKSSAKKAFKLGWIECTPAADNSSTHFQFSREKMQHYHKESSYFEQHEKCWFGQVVGEKNLIRVEKT